MLLYMLKECHISIMRAQLLINMIMRRVSKICDFVPYTDINPQLRRQRIIRDVLIYDCKPVCCLAFPNVHVLPTYVACTIHIRLQLSTYIVQHIRTNTCIA